MTKQKRKNTQTKAKTVEKQTAENWYKYGNGWGRMYGPRQEDVEDKSKLIPKDYHYW